MYSLGRLSCKLYIKFIFSPTVRVEIWLNVASIVVFELIVIDIVELVKSDPFHPVNWYPSFAVAVILMEVPSL